VRFRTKRALAITAVASLLFAACGGDDDTADAPAPADEPASTDASTDAPADEPAPAPAAELSGTLIGAGASSQAAAMQGW